MEASEIRWEKVTRGAPPANVVKSIYRPPVDTIEGWRSEIADYYGTMKDFIYSDSITIFQNLSQFSARASEMRSRISSTAGREETNFRTRVIDPFIEECDRQFKLFSRIQAIQEMEARMAGGVRA